MNYWYKRIIFSVVPYNDNDINTYKSKLNNNNFLYFKWNLDYCPF